MSTPTVGIVLVSHSAELAAGAAHLAAQVAVVGPARSDDRYRAPADLGTSAAKVADGLRRADQGAGVVVLPDLGSAVLTVKAVLEDHISKGTVLFADAPFVEGAVAATVTAAAGGDVKAVAAAAEEARHVRKL